ncbi:MAG TPA: hypothetical protein VMD59_09165 [Acidimicrobiales bacterium]|nr:hypothetical protein [Acidimicrobiales bacterium]
MSYEDGVGRSCRPARRALGSARARARRVARLVAAAGLVVLAALGLSACGGGPPGGLGVAAVPSTVQQAAFPTGSAADRAGAGDAGHRSGAGDRGASGARRGIGAGTSRPSGATAGSGMPVSHSPGSVEDEELEFAECMRSHGISGFPDPSAAGGFEVPAGRVVDTPRYAAAQKACQRYLPSGGGPGSGPPPTAQALAEMLEVSQCMRAHGIADFPDPRTSVPPLSPGIGVISDIDGVILVFPHSIDEQSPQFLRAAAACNFSLHNH